MSDLKRQPKPAPKTVDGLLRAMEPVRGFVLPDDFSEAMRLLSRPVFPITVEQYDAVLARGMREKCDVYNFRGGWVTYGSSNGGFALWELEVKPIPV
jgi:hypothetical protein